MAKTIEESLGIEFLLEEMAGAGQARDALDGARSLMAVFAEGLAKIQREGGTPAAPPAEPEPAALDGDATRRGASGGGSAPDRRDDGGFASWKKESAAALEALDAIRAELEKTAAAVGDALRDTRSSLDSFQSDSEAARDEEIHSPENSAKNAPFQNMENGRPSLSSDLRDAWDTGVKPLLNGVNSEMETCFGAGADGRDSGNSESAPFLNDLKDVWQASGEWLGKGRNGGDAFRDAPDSGAQDGDGGSKKNETCESGAALSDWRNIAGPALSGLRDASREIGRAIAEPPAGGENSFEEKGGGFGSLLGDVHGGVASRIREVGDKLPGIGPAGADASDAGGDAAETGADSSGRGGGEEDWVGRFGSHLEKIGKGIGAARQAVGNGAIPLQPAPSMMETAARITNNTPVRVNASIYAPNGDAAAIKNGLGGAVTNGVSQAFDNAAYNAEGGLGR